MLWGNCNQCNEKAIRSCLDILSIFTSVTPLSFNTFSSRFLVGNKTIRNCISLQLYTCILLIAFGFLWQGKHCYLEILYLVCRMVVHVACMNLPHPKKRKRKEKKENWLLLITYHCCHHGDFRNPIAKHCIVFRHRRSVQLFVLFTSFLENEDFIQVNRMLHQKSVKTVGK